MNFYNFKTSTPVEEVVNIMINFVVNIKPPVSKEIWKPIKGHVGLYEVSNFGRIKHLAAHKTSKMDVFGDKEFIVSPKLSRGYLQVGLKDKYNNRKLYYVHRLVAQEFCYNDDPINKIYVNHIDENKLNNKCNNLEWCTAHYNNIYNNRHTKSGIKVRIPVDIYRIKNGEEIFIETLPMMTDVKRKYGISYQAFYKYVDTNKIYSQRVTKLNYKLKYHHD